MNILQLFKPIRLLVLDVDGVLTNGTLILLDNGEQARTMNIKDGYAIQLAIKKGYEILIISGGNSNAVKLRLQKLGVTHIHFSIKNKLAVLQNFVQQYNIAWEQVLYMGDDVPDVQPMRKVSLACAPADAAQEVKNIAHYISPLNGGCGCVRDVIEKVLKLNNDWNELDDVASL